MSDKQDHCSSFSDLEFVFWEQLFDRTVSRALYTAQWEKACFQPDSHRKLTSRVDINKYQNKSLTRINSHSNVNIEADNKFFDVNFTCYSLFWHIFLSNLFCFSKTMKWKFSRKRLFRRPFEQSRRSSDRIFSVIHFVTCFQISLCSS